MKTAKQMFGKVVRDLEADERERKEMFARIERDQAESDARMDAPLSRREVLEAIEHVASEYAGSGIRDQELICDAFRKLVEALK